MANTTVSIRERIKTADGRWTWSPKIPIPEGKLKPAEAQRKGNFYLVYTERGKKREPKVKGKTFEAAVTAARAKQHHLEDAADGFSRPDPLKKAERKKIGEAIEDRLRRIQISFDWKTLEALINLDSISGRARAYTREMIQALKEKLDKDPETKQALFKAARISRQNVTESR